jgi:ribosomal protein L11 methyltransferase
VLVARENSKRNRVTQVVKMSLGDVSKLSLKPRVKFDVVCANLFYDLLMANADRLIARVKPGGVLVLAGILDKQFVEVKAVIENSGMKLKRTGQRGEWHSGTFVHAG